MGHTAAWRVLIKETVYRRGDAYKPKVKTGLPTWAEGVLELATMVKCFLIDNKSRKNLTRAHINQKLGKQVCDQELIAINKSFPLGKEKIGERFLKVVAPATVILVVRNPADRAAAFYGSARPPWTWSMMTCIPGRRSPRSTRPHRRRCSLKARSRWIR